LNFNLDINNERQMISVKSIPRIGRGDGGEWWSE
jgi:hypothetical protein